MAYEKLQDLECEKAVQVGGRDKKTGKANPTEVEGYYIGNRDVPSKFSKTGLAKLYILQTDSGNIGVYGKTNLDRKMTSAKIGRMTLITHTGSVPTNKGNDMLTYSVQQDPENTIDVNVTSTGVSNDDVDYDEPSDDSLVDDEPADEVAYVPPSKPARAASAPDAASQAKVKALFAGNRAKN